MRRDTATGDLVTHETDALVLAVGVTAMQRIVQANRALAARPEFARIMNLRGVDVVSVRVWLDRRVATQFPANVLAGFDESMGATYFNLNDLHVRLWVKESGSLTGLLTARASRSRAHALCGCSYSRRLSCRTSTATVSRA